MVKALAWSGLVWSTVRVSSRYGQGRLMLLDALQLSTMHLFPFDSCAFGVTASDLIILDSTNEHDPFPQGVKRAFFSRDKPPLVHLISYSVSYFHFTFHQVIMECRKCR